MKLNATRNSLTLHGFEPEQLLGVVSNSYIEHYLLGPSKYDVEHHRWACGGLSVDVGRYSFPVRGIGAFPKDRHCVGYMRSLTTPTWVNGFEFELDAIQFYPAASELNYCAGRYGEWVAIMFEEEALQAAATNRLGRELDLPARGAVNIPVSRIEHRALDRFVWRLMQRSVVDSEFIESFLAFIAGLLIHLQRDTLGSLVWQWRNRQALLARADEYLRVRVGRPFDARKLAAAVGITERSLQRYFADAYGVTPQWWARCLALHRARERLRTANPRMVTVEGIASECGFHHMGRFAEYYRDLFGELPSATLSEQGCASGKPIVSA